MTARDRVVLTVVIAAALLAGYWFMVLAPKRDEANKLDGQVTLARQQRDTAVADAAASRAARAQYAANYATVAQLGKAVPADDSVPSLVYQLADVSQASGVDFRSLKLASAAGAAASSAPPTSTSASGARSTATTTTSAAPVQAATAGLPPGATVGPAGLPTMPFSITFDGSFFHLSDFFARLESMIAMRKGGLDVRGRLLTIDGVSLTSGAGGFPNMQASVAATAFLLPADQGLTNGATPTTPSQSGGQSVSNKASSGGPSAPATIASPR